MKILSLWFIILTTILALILSRSFSSQLRRPLAHQRQYAYISILTYLRLFVNTGLNKPGKEM